MLLLLLSKRQSPTTVLFRTTLTQTITQYELQVQYICPLFQTEISGKYIVIVLISRSFYFLSSLRRGDQSTVFCIVSFDFNWSRSPKIRHPSALVCRCGLADIRRFVCKRKPYIDNCIRFTNHFTGLSRSKTSQTTSLTCYGEHIWLNANREQFTNRFNSLKKKKTLVKSHA